MRRCVITPTFEGHFDYVKNLLISYEKEVVDKYDYVIITGSDKESRKLRDILRSKKWEWLKIYNITDILAKYGIHVDVDNLLKKVGRFSFQTIKKLYPMLYLDYEQYLVIDSESIFLRKTSLNKIFTEWEKQKTLFYSSMNSRNMSTYKNWLDYKTSINCAKLLGYKFDNKWRFETFNWIYEKRIVADLFSKFNGDLYHPIYNHSVAYAEEWDKAIFEIILYSHFVSKNSEKYGYRQIDVIDELKRELGEDLCQEMIKKTEPFPYLIHGWEILKYRDISKIAKIYRKYKLFTSKLYLDKLRPKKIVRYHYIKKTGINIGVATTGISLNDAITACPLMKKIELFIRGCIRYFKNPQNRK